MASLFGGLLPAVDPAKSALFAPQSKYRSAASDASEDASAKRAKKAAASLTTADATQKSTKVKESSAALKRPAEVGAEDAQKASSKKKKKSTIAKDDVAPQEPSSKTSEAPTEAEGAASAGAARRIERKRAKEASTSKPQDPFVDESLDRTVFVGNLPAGVTKKALTRLFRACGAVETVRLRSIAVDPETKMKRKSALLAGAVDASRGSGHAYVVFAEAAHVAKALELNMTEFEDRHIRVDRAAPSQSRDMSKLSGKAVLKIDAESKVTYDPARSVFAGNLPKDIEDEDVIRFFSDSSVSSDLRSAVEAVRVVRDRYTREGKGIAFVLYKTRSAARSATLLNGHKLKDRAIRVSKVERAEGADGGRSWQGARASAKGKGASAAHSVKKLSKGGVRKVKPKPRSLGGKRPAVAARKAQQKAMRRRG